MKPVRFNYVAVETIEEAVLILTNSGPDARVISGGQSLMPMLNFRLARPALLVDIAGISELSGVTLTDDGVRVGAMTRTRDIEVSPVIAKHQPLLAEGVPHIAHLPIRSRGTIGGSLSHADPAAEFPALALALDATMTLQGGEGTRQIPAANYFRGLFETAIQSSEILTTIDFPAWPEGRKFGFQEYSRRRGDFALAGVVFWADLQGDICDDCRVVAFGVSDRPIRLPDIENIMKGHPLGDADALWSAHTALRDLLEPDSDLQATADYRRILAGELLERSIRAAGA